ncbi:helix-turn-helix transcriptional regulator, partial [Kaistella sp.]|uniref:helix-turn-helix transcriptional regulator n=1 Tax=Kaistella sp. TaxID=2782235 RepID=UPI003C5A3CCB
MSSNKNALIRYKTLDKCLKNTFKKYTLEDLIEQCSEALFEYEGKESFVSKRTVQLDLQNMRSEKFGYEAPIEVFDRKFYRYSDSEYSIHHISVTENDLKTMNNAIQILKQFKDFSMFKEMNGVIQKLEDSVNSVQEKSIIHLDKNERLKGLEFIDVLYQAILNKKVLRILYKSFNAREAQYMSVHPQLLKEYNNRWFLICWNQKSILNLALDRIEEILVDEHSIYIDKDFNADRYFGEVIGATVSETQRPQNVIFKITRKHAPYIITKPFHHTQEILEEDENGITFKICVQLNFELERMILGMGEFITVLAPRKLKQRIVKNLKLAVENYLIDDK